MNIRQIIRYACCALILSFVSFPAAAEEFTNAIRAYLQQRVEAEKVNCGIVVGIVDEHGSSIIRYGKLDNGTDQEVDGDTVFEIGSVTKTFTGLLLDDIVERGEMKLEDPVAKYLPASVKRPTFKGKEITVLHLATQTTGLPFDPDNYDPKLPDHPYADYSVEKMYNFLSRCQLTREPGMKFEYSNLGVGLLGNIIALNAGTNYESLVLERICLPLKMDNTRITLTPEMKARLVQGHNKPGYAVPSLEFVTIEGSIALRSTGNEMLKYMSASLGLTPLMEKAQQVHFYDPTERDMGLAWWIIDRHGTTIVCHGGGTGGCWMFLGFDKVRRRGVAVLWSLRNVNIENLGFFLLESEWQSDRRPTERKINSQVYGSYVGQYQRSADFAQRRVLMRQFLVNAPKVTTYLPAGFCLAVLLILLWRADSFRKRWTILGCAVLGGSVLATFTALVLNNVVGLRFARSEPGIGIRREGYRLFAQATGARSWPVTVLLPAFPGELLPESETRFFERLSGSPMSFSRDARGSVTRLTALCQGAAFLYEKISDEPPKAPEPLKLRAAIKVQSKLLDACVGHYKFAPNAGAGIPSGGIVTMWREGDQLLWQASGKDFIPGAINLYPESETNFFIKIDGAQLTFVKNDQREVTSVIHHQEGVSDCVGKKLKE